MTERGRASAAGEVISDYYRSAVSRRPHILRPLLRVFVVAGFLLAAPRVEAAPEPDTVALLPLDADARLAIYGQPVASEIARALVAGGIDVLVVGPTMAVPERARLIVDGSIASKGEAVVLSIRVRNPSDGTVLETLSETAARLATIDQAAAALSARVVPVVTERFAALRKPPVPEDRVVVVPAPQAVPRLLVAVMVGSSASADVEPLRLAFIDTVTPWTRATHRVGVPIDAAKLERKVAPTTVAANQAEHGVVFEILGYTVTPGKVPLARARVRIQISDASAVMFDRVVATDTIVGDRDMPPAALAARVTREILAILAPHLRKLEATWR